MQPLTILQAKRMFARLDLDMDGQITHSEFIRGLAANPGAIPTSHILAISQFLNTLWSHKSDLFLVADIANLLGLPSKIRQEDGSRELYQASLLPEPELHAFHP